MMRLSFGAFSVFCCAVLFSASAQAACGGGGFKPGSSKPAAMSQPVAMAQPVSQSYTVSYSHTIPTLDMRHFDETGKKLQITDAQQADINKLREEVAKKSAGLRSDVDRAQANFDACNGNCDKEKRKLDESKAKLSDFENREFSPRALGILTEDQRKLLYERNEAK